MSAWHEFIDYVALPENWWGARGIAHRLWDHIRISAMSLAIVIAIAVPPALWLGHLRRGGVLSSVVNVARAIPSYAIVALALPVSLRWGFGLGFWPTVVALVALGLPPIFTNTYAGMAGVDASVVDAARGMGMRPLEVLARVEVPNALPLILTGLRVSAVQIVATATLGAFVGFGGLGAFINEGFRQQNDGKLLTGAFLVAVLSLLTEVAFGAGQHLLTPWIRRNQQ